MGAAGGTATEGLAAGERPERLRRLESSMTPGLEQPASRCGLDLTSGLAPEAAGCARVRRRPATISVLEISSGGGPRKAPVRRSGAGRPAPPEEQAVGERSGLDVVVEERHLAVGPAHRAADVEARSQAPEDAASRPWAGGEVVVRSDVRIEVGPDEADPAPEEGASLVPAPDLPDAEVQLERLPGDVFGHDRPSDIDRDAFLNIGGFEIVDGDPDRPGALSEGDFGA